MRKRNEGYVLPLVLVVMVVMSLIAVGVMSVALRNLQSQKASIARMQDRYAAQGDEVAANGRIEELVAQLVTALENNEVTPTIYAATQQPKVENIVKSIIPQEALVRLEWTGETSCTLTITASCNAVTVEHTLVLENVIVQENDVYKIAKPDVVTVTEEGGDAGA